MSQEPGRLRASDADRERVAERLREALAEGRLTAEEHEERIDAVYRAKTLGELVPITDDLPEPGSAWAGEHRSHGSEMVSEEARALAEHSQGQESIVAVFGGADRAGRWLVEPRTTVSILCGGVDLDLREAVLAEREVVMQCAVIAGGLDIRVPPGVRVVNEVNAILGGVDVKEADQVTDVRAPTVRLTGTCLLGGIAVRVKRRKKKKC